MQTEYFLSLPSGSGIRKTLPSVSRSLMPLRQRSSSSHKSIETLLSSLHSKQSPSKPPRWTFSCFLDNISPFRSKSDVQPNGLAREEPPRSLTETLRGLRHIDSDCSSVEVDTDSSSWDMRWADLAVIFVTFYWQEKSIFPWKDVETVDALFWWWRPFLISLFRLFVNCWHVHVLTSKISLLIPVFILRLRSLSRKMDRTELAGSVKHQILDYS